MWDSYYTNITPFSRFEHTEHAENKDNQTGILLYLQGGGGD